MPSHLETDGSAEPNDPYHPSRSLGDELGPIPPPPPPIWWILPGSLVSIFLCLSIVGFLSVPLGETVMFPALAAWAGLLAWSLWATFTKRGDSFSIYARSYLLANALVAFLVGLVGTTCSGLSFGASSGSNGEFVLWLLLCILAVSVGIVAFRWPRKT